LDHGIVPIAKAMDRRHVPMYVTWPVTFTILMIASVFVAYLLHLFVEKPTLRLREKLAA
jgi:peptidoglycan/LPS O-acetylase OafA/YrhL